MPQVLPGRAVERPARPQHDGRRELEREPLPVAELEGRDHPHREHRQREHAREHEPTAQVVAARFLGGRRLGRRQAGGVARLLDHRDEPCGVGLSGVVLDDRLLGRVVDGCADAVELVQSPLDARSARRARHSLDRQVEPLDDAHRATCAANGTVCTTPPVLNCRKRRYSPAAASSASKRISPAGAPATGCTCV